MAKTYQQLGQCPNGHEWVIKQNVKGQRSSRSGRPVGFVCPFCGYAGRIRVKREVKDWS
jgi:hypothetical protein